MLELLNSVRVVAAQDGLNNRPRELWCDWDGPNPASSRPFPVDLDSAREGDCDLPQAKLLGIVAVASHGVAEGNV